MEGHQRTEGEAAVCDRDEGWRTIRHRGHLGELEEPQSREWIRTFAIITTPANELVAEVHDRMPLILPPDQYARWLGEESDPRDLLSPFPAGRMRKWPVSTRVNKPENNDPSILNEVQSEPSEARTPEAPEPLEIADLLRSA
jgi:putative SOS response-associated peptidase YedK